MTAVVVINSGAHTRNQSGIISQNNQNTKRKSEEHRIKRNNSKPRKQKNEYPKRGGKGSGTKKKLMAPNLSI